MRTLILAIIVILSFSSALYSQTTDYSYLERNGVYAETYLIRHDFSRGYVSINYERNIGKKYKTNIRIGLYPDFQTAISLPMTISWITKPLKNNHFEYGVGYVIRIEHFVDPYGYNSKEWFFDVPAVMIPLMYRYQKNSGFFLRAGVNLFVSWPTLPSPSFSAGYRF